MKSFLSSLALLSLAACATAPIEVDRPVPVSCVPAGAPVAPANPYTPAAMKAAADAAARHQLLAEFWTTFSPVVDYQSALVESCRKAAPPPSHQ